MAGYVVDSTADEKRGAPSFCLIGEVSARMVSKTSVYIIRAMTVLARAPEDTWVGTASLAEQIDAPVNYLGKLLHRLSRQGLLLSQKGVGGGVRLARDARSISLYQALETFENFDRWHECLLGVEGCPKQPCVLAERWSPVRERYLRFLQETTAADLAGQPAACVGE
ncbi:MAG: Rrf2 family transcriptional regulator [Nitrospiraceae bacterium]|nr:Rrf2 family transcriptional regulator [Nitrospiraceae bacterium]